MDRPCPLPGSSFGNLMTSLYPGLPSAPRTPTLSHAILWTYFLPPLSFSEPKLLSTQWAFTRPQAPPCREDLAITGLYYSLSSNDFIYKNLSHP